ncbi:XRE family transcriptional regulator [Chryseobacterium carnipullorum]|jgi:transcriptional regulator with XRE-family HTH domain|uniref:XRE family transcriptional regulator n=1 Tax=Chryseobacterium carnipullorum TaxID=1124835 RepID=A0A376DTK3_CHRCU|nr:helix-turn-helix transcriptional regulator [Chryseobacterium carnipullorum]AZA49717.1 XRE family transcriptional regulator [Chryseobacterium carnipullorum]AZA64608.1 XRE family transcriptional regulator [Chryseobacterium carnipullorum]STC95390.1 Uncharacterised protein [Chryseobacterium carnipullorum]
MKNLRIREIAGQKNIKISEIAEFAECSPQMMNNYLNETHGIPLDKLFKIANKLNCEIFELINVSEKLDHLYTGSGEWLGIRKK